MSQALSQVHEFWNKSSCGEVYAEGETELEKMEAHARKRYELEPYLPEFALFDGLNKDILEIGVGFGADHVRWAQSKPNFLYGIDLTERAVANTKRRLDLYGLESEVRIGNAEKLDFDDESLDLVYSWGVLHHSPNTPQAIKEVWRVLKPGGEARIMIYHRHSMVGYMLWARYALMKGKPFTSLREIFAKYNESPGTKAYTVKEARQMFSGFTAAHIWTGLTFGDLLEGATGQRHKGKVLRIAKKLWPRWFIKTFMKNHGLAMFIRAIK